MPPSGEARASPSPQEQDCRCECGALLARVVPEGIELKCRRCRRTILLKLFELKAVWTALER